MKSNLTLNIIGKVLSHITKEASNREDVKKAMLSEYHRIIENSKDIGRHNTLMSAYALGVWFIAMNRTDGLSPQRNYEILENGLRNNRLFPIVMGNADSYLDPKRIKKQEKWSAETHKKIYENDWVVDIIPGCGSFQLGYDYLECGICKLFKDEGCFELAKYLCKLDYLLADVMGLRLDRTQTLADGGKKCDFRFSRK